uniref:DUF3453 domain-containing protein n=1 Tax=Heterorhabditis bacteriophora TaxID=37862 RepID=A0A1I7XLI2_HETBA
MAKPEEFIEPLDNNDAVAEQVGEALRQAQNNTNVDVKLKSLLKVMIVCSNLYPIVLKWAVGRRSDLEAEKCWEAFCVLKGRIMHHIDSDNEGIRTMTLKFLESIVLAQSLKTEDSECGRGDIISLNDVPRDHRFISYRKMQAEANGNLQSLLDQTTLNHISAQNLLTVISVVCTISRQRPEYMMKVLDCLEVLHVNLPPTLLTSQVKSVRKELKMNLLRMLKHPSALPIHNRIITLLTDLGATQNEMNRAMPINILDLRRKKRPIEGEEPAAKKMKQDENLGSNHLEDDEYADESSPLDLPKDSARQSAIDITADFIFERLNPKVVANLVLISLMTQPDEMPAAFQSSYTPIAAAGTESQRRHLARMMATQATQQELGPGVEQMRKEKLEKFHERQTARREGAYIPPTPAIHASGHSNTSGTKKSPASGMPSPVGLLSQIIVIQSIFDCIRFLDPCSRAAQGGAGGIHHLILVRLASRFHSEAVSFEQIMIDFIVDEHKQRTDLALLWVAELYAQYQGFSFCYVQDRPDGRMSSADLLKRYDRVVCGLLRKLFEREQHKEAVLLNGMSLYSVMLYICFWLFYLLILLFSHHWQKRTLVESQNLKRKILSKFYHSLFLKRLIRSPFRLYSDDCLVGEVSSLVFTIKWNSFCSGLRLFFLDIETGEPTISAADLIYEYHKIEPSTSEERQLQIDNLSELVDSRALSKESVASAVERLMDLRPLPALFYYSLVVVYKKYPSLDGFLSNVIHKVINKELWMHDDITKNAFFRSLSHLKAVAYTVRDINVLIIKREERDRDREKERDREERRERERDRKERRDSRKSVGQ